MPAPIVDEHTEVSIGERCTDEFQYLAQLGANHIVLSRSWLEANQQQPFSLRLLPEPSKIELDFLEAFRARLGEEREFMRKFGRLTDEHEYVQRRNRLADRHRVEEHEFIQRRNRLRDLPHVEDHEFFKKKR